MNITTYISELVNEVVKRWDTSFGSLSLSDGFANLVGLGANLKRISTKLVPVRE